MATNYAKYVKSSFPAGTPFRARENKLIETAQNGISDENSLRNAIASANDGDLIQLAPVTITLTKQLVITKQVRIKGSTQAGVRGSFIVGALTVPLISIDLAAHSANGEVAFESVTITQNTSGQDTIVANNTNAAATLYLRFNLCNIQVSDVASVASAINVSHAVTGQAIQLLVSGRGTNVCDTITYAVKNAADVIEIHKVKLRKQGKATAIITSADAVAAQIRLFDCQVPATTGVSGGNAAQLLFSVHGHSLTGTTYANAAAGDYVGSQTKTVI